MTIERVQQLERELQAMAAAGQYEPGALASALSRLNDAWAALSPDEQARCHRAGRRALALSDEEREPMPVTSLTCGMADWLALGPQLVADMPSLQYVSILCVDLSDGLLWSLDEARLPSELHGYFTSVNGKWQYSTEEKALDALSAACLAWARARHKRGADQ